MCTLGLLFKGLFLALHLNIGFNIEFVGEKSLFIATFTSLFGVYL